MACNDGGDHVRDRIKRIQNYIGDRSYLTTHGDELANIDTKSLIGIQSSGKLAAVSTEHPSLRSGELATEDGRYAFFGEPTG
jgi:glucose-1-phosphate cytidylyltransferase